MNVPGFKSLVAYAIQLDAYRGLQHEEGPEGARCLTMVSVLRRDRFGSHV